MCYQVVLHYKFLKDVSKILGLGMPWGTWNKIRDNSFWPYVAKVLYHWKIIAVIGFQGYKWKIYVILLRVALGYSELVLNQFHQVRTVIKTN